MKTRVGGGTMVKLIESLSRGVPNALVEVVELGRTLKKRADASWPTSRPAAPPTAAPKRSVSVFLAGPGLAGQMVPVAPTSV